MNLFSSLDPLKRFSDGYNNKTKLTILTSAVGLILFVVIATMLPFKDKLLNYLYPKPKSQAQTTPIIYSPKVLAVSFNPTETEGSRDLASTYYSGRWGGRTVDQVEDTVFNGTIAAFNQLSNNTINYQIVNKIRINQFPTYTNGFQYTIDNFANCINNTINTKGLTCEQQKSYFDQLAWIRDNQICERADQLDVDEVWVLSVPYIMRWESFMFGPSSSFSVNSPPVITPQCRKHYVLMAASYETTEPILHMYGHRIESFMSYLTGYWQSVDKQKYWENFAAVNRYGNQSYYTPNCGNAHFPANAAAGYDYTNQTTGTFSCPDWKNFPDFTGATESINCNSWGCSDPGWQKYWFGSIPRSQGEVTMTSANSKVFSFKKNWWYYLLYPENAISFNKQFLAPTPTPAPNSCQVSGITCGTSTSTSITIDNITLTDNGWGADGMAVYLQGGTRRIYTNFTSSYTVNSYLTSNTVYDVKVGCYKDNGAAIPPTTGWSNTITCSTSPVISPTPTPTPTPAPIFAPTPDTTPPSVNIISPVNGSTVGKNSTVNITASASDNVGVSKVEFYVSGALKCTDTTAPYSCSWIVPKPPKVTYLILAKAYDTSNNSALNTINVISK